jgi:hypothetical protein
MSGKRTRRTAKLLIWILAMAAIILFLTGWGATLVALARIGLLGGDTITHHMRIYHVGLFGTSVTDAQLQSLVSSSALSGVRKLNLGRTQISDDALACLQELPQLEVLWLQFTTVGDAGLEHVAALPGLQSLDLRDVPISDAGLVHIGKLGRLDLLDLSGTGVTDAGLVHLHGLRNLQSLSLHGTAVTEAGLRRLHRALPRCQIHVTSLQERMTDLGIRGPDAPDDGDGPAEEPPAPADTAPDPGRPR